MKSNKISKIDSLLSESFGSQVYSLSNNYEVKGSSVTTKVISFALDLMGIDDIPLHDSGANVPDILDLNDIIYRRTNLPLDISTEEYQPLIVFGNQDQPFVLFRRIRSTYIYDSAEDKITLLSEQDLEIFKKTLAIEIYPPLPQTVDSVDDLFDVAFGGQSKAILALILTASVVALLSLSIPLYTNYLVTSILPFNQKTQLLESLVVVVLILFSVIAAQFLQARMVLRLETSSDFRLQTAIWDRTTKLPLNTIGMYTPADVVSRVDGISKIRSLLSNGILTSIVQSLFSLSFFVLMFIFDSSLAWIAFGSVCLYLFFVVQNTLKSVRYQQRAFEAEAENNETTYQSVVGYAQVKTSGSLIYVMGEWLKSIVSSSQAKLKSSYFVDNVSLANSVVLPLSNIFIFTVPVYQALVAQSYDQILNVSAKFISFYSAYTAFMAGVTSTTSLFSGIYPQVAVLWKRAKPIIYSSLESGRSYDSVRHQIQGSVKAENIAYTYPEAIDPVLVDIDFQIDFGSHVAFTGPSGCGKTTLMRLLLGLDYPSSGLIAIDHLPLEDLSISYYRRQVGFVMQELKLPPGTIADVIKGSKNLTDEEIWSGLEMACFADDVHAMPMQLNTILTSGGSALSGGQRQRIAIARALVKKPKLLIMDEATSALDNITQQKITQTINDLGVTRISVAHRLSTIRQADEILVLDKGVISEKGTWADLSKDKNSYIGQRVINSRI